MLTLEEHISNLSEEELKSCFNDIKEYFYGNEGVLPKGSKVRELLNIFNTECNTNLALHAVPQYFLYEMAKRYYNS